MRRTKVIIVDFHAEATSEKVAMGWHLDGKVTLVVGTHTHVQTADERILPNGTAYLTDAGMTGPHDSIIGMEREPSLARFLNGMPSRFEPATGNPAPQRRHRRGRRQDREGDRDHPHQLFRARLRSLGQRGAPAVSTFFDLPFEDAEPEPSDRPSRKPRARPPVQPRAGLPSGRAARRIYTVAQLTARIRSLLEREFFEVWVEGELSNCKVWNTGHMYFTLKDARRRSRA